MSMNSVNFLKPEMAHDVLKSDSFFWTSRFVDITVLLMLVAVQGYHAFKEWRGDDNKKKRRRSSKLMGGSFMGRWTFISNVLTWIYFGTATAVIFLETLIIWEAFAVDVDLCNGLIYLLVVLFHINKSSFYALLVARLQLALGLSASKYSLKIIMGLFVAIVIYLVFVLTGSHYAIYGKWLKVPQGNWCHIHIREGSKYEVGILFWILSDFGLSIFLLFLFIRPLSQHVAVMSGDSRKSKKENKLYQLMVKCSILTSTTVLITIFSLFLYLWKHISILIEVNYILSCLCLLLMHRRYRSVYRRLCMPCHLCIQGKIGEDKDKLFQDASDWDKESKFQSQSQSSVRSMRGASERQVSERQVSERQVSVKQDVVDDNDNNISHGDVDIEIAEIKK